MQKTNKEIAEFYGIKVGDVVKIYDQSGISDYDLTFNVVFMDGIKLIRADLRRGTEFDPWILATRKYEVIKPKKKYGDLKCNDFDNCSSCPLRAFTCDHAANTLYGILEEGCIAYGYYADHPIYKAFKAELDKEVE